MSDPRHDDPDAEPTPEELAEAEALARVLDGAPTALAQPPAGTDAALLVRHSRDGGEIAEARANEVLARVQAEHARRRRTLRLLIPGVALAAAAAVALAFFGTQDPEPDPAARIPRPSADLLRAQVAAASGHGTAELDQAMREYRDDVYGALSQRYGAGD